MIARHERYLRLQREGTAHQFRIAIPGIQRASASSGTGSASTTRTALEAGWSVEEEYRGRGIAPAAVIAMLEWARANGDTLPRARLPAGRQPASNAVCRKAGFTLRGEEDFEVTPGNVLHTNDWVVELVPATA